MHSRPHCGRRIAADACGRRIGVIAAITCQIGRMRPTVRPTRGRRIAADYERYNAFLVFITNAADARPTHNAFIVGRNASTAMRQTRVFRNAADYEPTFKANSYLHAARSTDEKLNEWIPIVWFILTRSMQHATRSTDENSRVEQISTFPLKIIYLINNDHAHAWSVRGIMN